MSWIASSGLRAWTIQRLSAVYMVLFTSYAAVAFLTRESSGYEQWLAWVSHPFNNICIGLFIFSLIMHAWVGSRDIILDYVHSFPLRMIKLAVLALLLIAMALWAFKILLNLSF